MVIRLHVGMKLLGKVLAVMAANLLMFCVLGFVGILILNVMFVITSAPKNVFPTNVL